MGEEIQIIVIDKLVGQYTVSLPEDSMHNFLYLKQICVLQTWDQIKNDPVDIYYPVFSTSEDDQDQTKMIDEDYSFEHYKLHRGGILFLHYIKLDVDLRKE